MVLNIYFSIIKINLMLADFYIPGFSTDMKIAVHKNHLGGQILYRSVDPAKKRRLYFFLRFEIYKVKHLGPKF